jgi:Na+/H+ antiporter NhaC
LQGLLASLEGILLDMKSMIKIPFDKGLANTQVSQITSTNLLHQSFNLDKASEIYNEAKSQFESLIGERDNTKINYNKNKSLFNFWFLLVILVIFIFILFFKGYNVFNNNLIYLLLALLFYLFFDIFKQKFLIIYNFIILIWNNIINFLRLFN